VKANTEIQAALASHLAKSVHDARRGYRKRLKQCQKKFSRKAVHDLRVETRRLLAMLEFLEALHFKDSPEKTAKMLKKRLDALDNLRDTQVQLSLLKPLWTDFPEARPLKKSLQRCERRLIKRGPRKLKGRNGLAKRLKDLEKELCGSGLALPTSATDDPGLAALRNCFQRAVALRRRIRRNNPATIHKMRVAFKRFRYLSELLQPLLPQITPEQLRRMRKYQGLAGDIQDLEVLLARLKCLVDEKKLSEPAVKRLRLELQARKKRALDFFMNRMDELFQFQPDEPAKAMCG